MSCSPTKPRTFLAELNPNQPSASRPVKKAKTSSRPSASASLRRVHILMLPSEILEWIYECLDCKELISSVQYVCKDWAQHANSTSLWQKLAQSRALESTWIVKKTSCMVERRSKGKLFAGTLRTSGQSVNLKKVRLDVTNAGSDDGVPTSLLREVSYLSTLDHPNVAKMHFAEVKKEFVLLCSEHTTFNLAQYLKQSCSMDVKSLMAQLLQALDYTHHCGIMHRNLKPDNILVTAEGQVKLADFTLARLCVTPHVPYTPEDPKERDRSGREARRLWYRPPEMLMRKEMYSYEVDMWAAGCLLAEMACGEPLFTADTEIEQLFRIFKLIGSPGSDLYPSYANTFPKWEPVVFSTVLSPAHSPSFANLCATMLPARETSLLRLQAIGKVLGPQGLDLLQRCLELNPATRISAAGALRHPFFSTGPSLYSSLAVYKSPAIAQIAESLNRLHSTEVELALPSTYLSQQTEVNEVMRAILVDWLVDVSVHFELMDETLHLGVSYIDRTLAKTKIEKVKLQLLGVACMKIADVYNERSKEYYRQDNSAEYAYITADEYKAAEVVQMEKQVLTLLSFRLQSATVVHFVKLYQRVLETDHSVYVLQLVRST